jgi:hypothetical protein
MRTRLLLFATLAAVLLPSAAQAQRVFADVRVGEGPVSGHILITMPDDGNRDYGYHGPRDDSRYRVVEVSRSHRGGRWYRYHGYRPVQVWYDDDRDCYYDRYDRSRGRLREIVIYERDGRYYRDDDRDEARRHGWRDDDGRANRNDYRDRTDRRRDDDRN